jgi:hypothetical protein
MGHIFQTRFGEDGNCFEARVAELFGCSLEEVPVFSYELYGNARMQLYFQ